MDVTNQTPPPPAGRDTKTGSTQAGEDITSVLREDRHFEPATAFQSEAHIKSFADYERIWRRSVEEPEAFWAEQASELLIWSKRWDKVLEWRPPHAKWFSGGRLNASVNCLDRHLNTARAHKAAIIWEGEDGTSRTLTYRDLYAEVCKLANGLRKIGVCAGDRISIYMPLVPEVAIATLACARIGAVHSVIFGGFSAEALASRNRDAQATVVITADGGRRAGKVIPLKENVDQAMAHSPSVQKVVVLKHAGQPVTMNAACDVWWHELTEGQSSECDPEMVESEHPLFMLYTSGSTGRPKGILHTTAGYLLGATLSCRYVFDLKDNDVYWCTADAGWITGHSYVIYGPLANGATVLMYEGAPLYPNPDRFWEIVAKHRVSIFYTAPTAIRTFMKMGDSWPARHDLSSLRLLGTVGEPINPEAWMWYRKNIGGDRCPIVDTWWQTETGSIMITPLPGVTPTIPGSATLPFFGVNPRVVDEAGKEVERGQGGYLVLTQPWPSMLRTIYGDDERYQQQYWSQVPGMYFTGDGARQDERGYFWILGRIDDVLNVSGHRLSTMEIESALVSHAAIAEAAVVGRPDNVKGEAVIAFVTVKQGTAKTAELQSAIRAHVVAEIGALARPEEVRFADSLPKTRSGKIMRRLLRDIAMNRLSEGDTTTLEDHSVLDRLRAED